MKWPIDKTSYPQDPRVVPLNPNLVDGSYVFVQDAQGTVYVLPDGFHLHPKVLGGGKPAHYAGDLTIQNAKVVDVTNLSGTFQFDDEEGLKKVAEQIRRQGINLEVGAVRFFPSDGSLPVILE